MSTTIYAQDPAIEVTRTKVVDRSVPVRNVHVDVDDQRWVANVDGLTQVYTTEQGVAQQAVGGKINILMYPDGNYNLVISTSELKAAIGEETAVSSMRYDAQKKELWVGTGAKGVFHLRVEPAISKISQLTTENSKLTTNSIRSIFLDPTGTIWIGTDDGALIGKGGNWSHTQEYFHINAFDYHKGETWVAADELLWWVNRRGKWSPLELTAEMLEGPIVDISFDTKGRLWIASEIMTRFDIDNDTYRVWGPKEYFTSQFVNRIDVDADDAVWIATEDKGLYVIQSGDALNVKMDLVQALDCKDTSSRASIAVEVFGGTEPIEYVWEDGFSGTNRDGLTAGVYKLTVSDAVGKSKESAIEIPNPVIDAKVTVVSFATSNEADGVAEAIIEGGSPPYKVSWDNGETGMRNEKLAKGYYIMSVEDNEGCTTSVTFEIPEEIEPLSIVDVEFIEENKCFGDQQAQFMIITKGGVEPLQQNFDQQTASVPGAKLVAGVYQVTVTDAAGNSATTAVQVIQPEQLSVDAQVTASASANNADGAAEISVTGGTGKYTYAWSNNASSDKSESLAAGEYKITVTDENGCSAIADINVTEDILPLAVNIEAETDLLCATDAQGKVKANVSGGKSPYKYYWNSDFITDEVGENLVAGTYSVTVTDAADQTAAAVIILAAPDPMEVNVNVTSPASTGQSDGQAQANAKGGTGKYDYKWDNGETKAKTDELAAGSHQLVVTDENGCTVAVDFEVTEDILPLIVELNVTNENNCPGSKSNVISSAVNGGKGPYTYKWSNGSETSNIDGLSAGAYTLEVSDASGQNTSVDVILTDPDPIVVAVQVTASATTNETDGQAAAKISGGFGKYTFAWDNGESKEKASELSPGTHELVVTDENGCTGVASFTITEDILPLSVSLEVATELNCPGDEVGEITSIVAGGKEPFEYSWSSGQTLEKLGNLAAGEYILTVTDAAENSSTASVSIDEPSGMAVVVQVTASATANQNDGQAKANVTGGKGKISYQWDNGETKDDAEKLGPGAHTLIVSDANGCSAETTFEITEDILPLSVSVDVANELSCPGDETGEITSTVAGGKAPFEYNWSGGQTAEKIVNIGSGEYTLTVTDAAGNSSTTNLTIDEPKGLAVTVQVTASATTNQNDGQAKANISGGNGKISYQWDNGETKDEVKTLGPGEHKLTVTDANGCTAETIFDITEDILPLAISVNKLTEIKCAGGNSGALEATVAGGKSPFSYAWSNGLKESTAEGLSAGLYTITVKDAAGTEATAEVNLEEPQTLSLELETVSNASANGSDGVLNAIANGGTKPYSYSWSNGAASINLENIAAGEYTLVVEDANGCSVASKATITEEILPLAVTLSVSNPISCSDGNDGQISASVKGGKSPYSFDWTGSTSTEASAQNLSAGEFSLMVKDASGLETTANIVLEAPVALSVDVFGIKPSRTETSSDGKAEAKPSGGNPPYSYTWASGETTPKANQLVFGLQKVTITDSKGCSVDMELDIKKKILPDLTAGMLRDGQTIKMETLQFDADSSTIQVSSEPVLNELYEFLVENPFIVVEIGGHTNGLPSHEFCDRLSSARAKEVATQIVGKGISAKRIFYKGYGKRKPVATNQTKDGRQKNQRVEVKILKLEGDG